MVSGSRSRRFSGGGGSGNAGRNSHRARSDSGSGSNRRVRGARGKNVRARDRRDGIGDRSDGRDGSGGHRIVDWRAGGRGLGGRDLGSAPRRGSRNVDDLAIERVGRPGLAILLLLQGIELSEELLVMVAEVRLLREVRERGRRALEEVGQSVGHRNGGRATRHREAEGASATAAPTRAFLRERCGIRHYRLDARLLAQTRSDATLLRFRVADMCPTDGLHQPLDELRLRVLETSGGGGKEKVLGDGVAAGQGRSVRVVGQASETVLIGEVLIPQTDERRVTAWHRIAAGIPGIGAEDAVEVQEEPDLCARELVDAPVGRREVRREDIPSVAVDSEVGSEATPTLAVVRHGAGGWMKDGAEGMERWKRDDEWRRRREARNEMEDKIEVEIDK